MIFISNIGKRDIQYNGEYIDTNEIRDKSKSLLNSYNNVKNDITFPILAPYLEIFNTQLNHLFLFVTNQEDPNYRKDDTIYIGRIIEKKIEEENKINVTIVPYNNNPTTYELIYRFYTDYFSQKSRFFQNSSKRIISLSGGTPQMNGALYVILSSLYPSGNEFYSVNMGKLIQINAEKTIKKIYIKNSSRELLSINQYFSIISLLRRYQVSNRDILTNLLFYCHHRKNFNFNKARIYLKKFKDSIPSASSSEYHFLELEEDLSDISLVKELYWRMEICHKNQNYLMFLALLFRLEEALLYLIIGYLFKDLYERKINDNKKSHPNFIEFLKINEEDLWTELNNKTLNTQPLEVRNELNRPILFFIAQIKIDQLKKEGNYIFQIGKVLEILDKINKYRWDSLKAEEREKFYNSYDLGTECLGDLRNQSIIAHGYNPVSKSIIERKYGDNIDTLLTELQNWIKKLISLITEDMKVSMENIFDSINTKVDNLIIKL